jgi:Fic family protein
MKLEDFANSPSGQLVLTQDGAQAFLPNSLPPNLDWSALARPLARAQAAIGQLKGVCRRVANPYILIRPMQRNEALTSSSMEGTHTTDDELVIAEAGFDENPDDDTREVSNFIRALSHCLKRIEDEPILNRHLCEAHHILLSGLSPARGANKLPGEFKRNQNMIGGKTLATARFIPTPPSHTPNCMSNLERFINRDVDKNSDPLIDIALAHYQFETIHPFADGNGRLGRMLSSLMAVKSGLLDLPTLYLSPVIEARKDEYIDAMYAVSARSEWTNWLVYFLSVVEQSCSLTIATVDRVIDLQKNYRDLVQEKINSANALKIIDMLFETPAVSVARVRERLSMSDVGARKLLGRLCDEEILVEYTKVYPRVFLARGIISATLPRPFTQPY